MPETFLININCSKILDDGDETQYAMFIDSTKMSIVYELVEWIRWMFSLESCIYLTHGGLVIHELEDIKFLSELKNFEVKPCGRSQCVHKRTYRTLLKNLDLFIYWNGMLVHKYFLHKLNQVDWKCSENGKPSPTKFTSTNNSCESLMEYKNQKADKTNSVCPEKLSFWETQQPKACTGNSQRKTLSNHEESEPDTNSEHQANSYFHKKLMQNLSVNGVEPNSVNDSNLGLPKNSPKKKTNNIAISNENSENNLEIYREPIKNNSKPISKKNYTKPFSLGELLSNLREDSEKKPADISKSSSMNSFVVLEDNFEEDVTGRRKRKRTRRRKKAKMQNSETKEFTSPFTGENSSETGFDFVISSSKPKPNHIRFEMEIEDNIMEADCLEDEQKTQPENSEKEIMSCNENTSGELLKSEPKKLKSVLNNSQILSEQSPDVLVSKITDSKVIHSPVGNPVIIKDIPICLDDQICSNPSQIYPSVENFKENKLMPDLNVFLSLKENCKNGVVVERFY